MPSFQKSLSRFPSYWRTVSHFFLLQTDGQTSVLVLGGEEWFERFLVFPSSFQSFICTKECFADRLYNRSTNSPTIRRGERGGRVVSVLSSGSEGRGIDPRLCCLPLDVVFLVSVFSLGRDLGRESSRSMAPSSSCVYLGGLGDITTTIQ